LDDDQVQKIYEDKNGTLWIGTNNGGLNEFNRKTGSFTSYQKQWPGFACVVNIFEDSKARLWAGTYMGGLFLFDRRTKTSKKFSEKDGLLYDGTSGILEDNKNNLWVVSARGISIIDAATNKIRKLTKNNGLPGEQLTRSAIKTSKGSFLITTKMGFYY
jgi:ligand-binding sensor domain-containing protein